MNTMGIFWLGVMILAAVVEAAVPSLVSVWFVPGGPGRPHRQPAGRPAVAAGGGVPGGVRRCPGPDPASFQAAAEPPPGAHQRRPGGGAAGLVTQDIDNVRATGRVSVMGNSWSARSVQPEGRIPAGTRVRVHAIEGVKLLVTPEAAPAQEEKER